MKHDDVIEELLAQDRVILAREHPKLENALVRAARAGRLSRLLPGVYADPGSADDLMTKVVAASRWDPKAVIRGRAAAALSYWDDIGVTTLEVASPVRHSPQPGFAFEHRTIPGDLVQQCGPFSFTVPALTAVELGTMEFTDPIDRALRKRVVTLEAMRDALERTPRRRGNRDRWRLLLDSRSEPWSRAERLAHRIYRGAGIAGWVTNLKTVVPDWGTYVLDIAFERQRLATEIDGRETHDNDDAFESDRERQNALVLAGWTFLRFTWRMLYEDPAYVVWATKQALAIADGRRPRAWSDGRDTPWWWA
jgi:very-short-patch-repair endonuclease